MHDDILTRLARGPGQRDESAHRRLAEEIARAADGEAVEALVQIACSAEKGAASDAIKVLGEIAARQPQLLISHVDDVAQQVTPRAGVFAWEGMAVLAGVAEVAPVAVAPHLEVLSQAIVGPSVIARDRAVRALVALARANVRAETVASLLLETLRTCPVNQLPTYAEQAAQVAEVVGVDQLRSTLEARAADVIQPAKASRIASVLRLLG